MSLIWNPGHKVADSAMQQSDIRDVIGECYWIVSRSIWKLCCSKDNRCHIPRKDLADSKRSCQTTFIVELTEICKQCYR